MLPLSEWRHGSTLPTEACPINHGHILEGSASWISRLSFQWMHSVMMSGFRKRLGVPQICLGRGECRCLTAAFEARLSEFGGSPRQIEWAIYYTFRTDIWVTGITRLAADLLSAATPYTLRFFLHYYQKLEAQEDGQSRGVPLSLAFSICLMVSLQSILMSHGLYRASKMGIQLKMIMTSMLMAKSLRIPKSCTTDSQEPGDVQKSDNKRSKEDGALISEPAREGLDYGASALVRVVDTELEHVEQACVLFHAIWTSPVAICLLIGFLVSNLGYSAMTGSGFMLASVPLLIFVSRILQRKRSIINTITKRRLATIAEVFAKSDLVKMMTLESHYLDKVSRLRYQEFRELRRLLNLHGGTNAYIISLPLLASAASFVTYAYSGHSIDASRIIPALALFNTMRLSLFLLPIAISRTLDGAAGLDAVKLYLEQPDAQKYVHIEPSMEVALRVSSASFTWNVPQARRRRRGYLMPNVDIPGNLSPPSVTASTADGFAIRIGDLEFLSGELTVIVGRVGSGKTSFLMALAGLMPKICGSVKARGKVSFCPKEPWLQSTTFRQNICFDENPRPALYRAILQACCLTEDINSFPDGDQILISGAGTSLSGGQRSRIGLARSLYEQSEIVLIDDCLSALDPKVRDHVFEQAIRGFLRHKCCIMATHDSKFASQAKTVVWLEDGEVKAVGNFYDLVQQHPTFADALGVTDSASKPGVVPQQIRSSSGFVAEQQSIVPALESAGYSPNERSTLRRFLRICLEEGSSLLWMYIALLLLSQTAYITFALWLSWWVSDALGLTTASYLIGLSLIALSQVVLLYFMSSVLVKIVTRVSRRLFDTSMRAVIFARAEFFRKNSLGTLVSIFSKNLDILDHRVIEPIRMCFIYVSATLSVLGIMVYHIYYSIVPILVLLLCFFLATVVYHRSAKLLKRYQYESQSKAIAYLVEAASGAETIRLSRREHAVVASLQRLLDTTGNAAMLAVAAQRWLSLRLDLVGVLLMLFAFLIGLVGDIRVSPSVLGILLTFALGSVPMLQSIVKQLTDIEEGLMAVRALDQDTRLIEKEQHSALHYGGIGPMRGDIVFNDVCMAYIKGAQPILNHVNLSIKAGEHVGIVGRTGSGKSSLITALLRLYEVDSGTITLDGGNVARMCPRQLRQCFSIVPQTPLLLQGTIRANLDPVGTHSEEALENILADVGFSIHGEQTRTSGPQISLDDVVEEGGSNFSYGERQMLACAKVLAKQHAGIVVLDEATSSLDAFTELKLQQRLIRTFESHTVLTITHKMHNVLLYDRIYVVNAGRIVESGPPKDLFMRQGSVFREMCLEQDIVL